MLRLRKKRGEVLEKEGMPDGVDAFDTPDMIEENSKNTDENGEEDSGDSGLLPGLPQDGVEAEAGAEEAQEIPSDPAQAVAQEEDPRGGITEEFRIATEAFAEGRGIAPGDLEKGMEMLKMIGEGWKAGDLTLDMLSIVLRGLEYDAAVAAAREAGEIAGRNAQIEEVYMRPEEGDGLPHLGGVNARRNGSRIASIFDLARNA